MSRFPVFLFMALLVSMAACKKDSLSRSDCARLKQGVLQDDVALAGKQVNTQLNKLPSRTNTPENLNNLAQALASGCGITARVLCFDCIETLPAQSEIRITVTENGTAVEHTIDISYTPENKMIFRNLHE